MLPFITSSQAEKIAKETATKIVEEYAPTPAVQGYTLTITGSWDTLTAHLTYADGTGADVTDAGEYANVAEVYFDTSAQREMTAGLVSEVVYISPDAQITKYALLTDSAFNFSQEE